AITKHQAARKGMPQVVKGEILQTCLLHRTFKRCPKIPVWSASRCPEYCPLCCSFHLNRLECCRQHVVHGNTTALAGLGIARTYRDDPTAEIDISPGQGEQFRGPKPGV